MRKLWLIIGVISLCLLFGCNSSPNNIKKSQATAQKEFGVFLEAIIQEQPNAGNNEVTRSMLADTIKARIQSFKGDTLAILKDLPMEYEMCMEYPRIFDSFESEIDKNAGKYIVKFSYMDSGNHPLTEKCQTAFQVFSVLTKEEVARLIDNTKYYINGTFTDFANNSKETGFRLPGGRCIISYPHVYMIDGKLKIDCGTLILENLKFRQAQ